MLEGLWRRIRPPSDRGALRRWCGAAVRYCYIVVFGFFTLSLVIMTLAAHRFQADVERQLEQAQDERSEAQPTLGELRLVLTDLQDLRLRSADALAGLRSAATELGATDRAGLVRAIERERLARAPASPPLTLVAQASSSGSAEASSRPEDGASIASAMSRYSYYLAIQADIDAKNTLIRDEFEGVYADLIYFDHLKFLTLYLVDPITFATMPGWLLTLVITLAMGALGSLLYVAKSYLSERLIEVKKATTVESKPLSWFVFRPLMGIVTAFAVFVFLQAGLALTEGTFGQGNETVNPYFVAFIGIVSGLMSWQAIERLEQWGKRFFGDENIGRWAYGMRDTFAVQSDAGGGKNPAELARFLGVTEAQIAEWQDEKVRVPADLQGKIADWFQTDRRHLFSDLTPTG